MALSDSFVAIFAGRLAWLFCLSCCLVKHICLRRFFVGEVTVPWLRVRGIGQQIFITPLGLSDCLPYILNLG